MIILQIVILLVWANVVAAFLHTVDRGRPRISVLTLAVLYLAWSPVSGLLWVGWGKLTGVNAHYGLGDSPSTSLGGGYRMIHPDSVDGLPC